MSQNVGIPRGVAGLLLLPLAACSMLHGPDTVQVSELRQLAQCNSDGPQTRLTLLADREAVRAWQQAHNVNLGGVDPLPVDGPYALVEMGVRMSAGYGIAVSRQATLGGNTLTLNASLFAPDPGQAAAEMVTSPCVLVALPRGPYGGVELRDPAGALLARADAVAPVQ